MERRPACLFLQQLIFFYCAGFSSRSIASRAEFNLQQVGEQANSKDHSVSNEKILQSARNQRKSAGNIFSLFCWVFLDVDFT